MKEQRGENPFVQFFADLLSLVFTVVLERFVMLCASEITSWAWSKSYSNFLLQRRLTRRRGIKLHPLTGLGLSSWQHLPRRCLGVAGEAAVRSQGRFCDPAGLPAAEIRWQGTVPVRFLPWLYVVVSSLSCCFGFTFPCGASLRSKVQKANDIHKR